MKARMDKWLVAALGCSLGFVLVGNAQESRHEPSEKDIRLFAREESELDGARYAVVVGIGSYKHSDVTSLAYATQDAKDVAECLLEHGWTVSLLTTDAIESKLRPDLATDIEDRIREYAKNAKENGTVLFYFSGHGFMSGPKEGYICPVLVDPRSSAQLENSGLSIRRIREALSAGGSQKKILILDACRNDPRAKSSFATGYTEEALRASAGLGVLYATAPGKLSYEPLPNQKDEAGNTIKNGLFTHFLLRGMHGEARVNGDEFLTFHELGWWVGEAMGRFTIRDEARMYSSQKPWMDWTGGSADDVLLFRLGNSKPAVASPPTLSSSVPAVGTRLAANCPVTFSLRFDTALSEVKIGELALTSDEAATTWSGQMMAPAAAGGWKPTWTARSRAGVLASGFLDLIVVSPPALISSTPAAGSVVESGAIVDLVLVFDRALSRVQANGSQCTLDGATRTARDRLKVPAGTTWQVPWEAVSGDGLSSSGVLNFSVVAPPEPANTVTVFDSFNRMKQWTGTLRLSSGQSRSLSLTVTQLRTNEVRDSDLVIGGVETRAYGRFSGRDLNWIFSAHYNKMNQAVGIKSGKLSAPGTLSDDGRTITGRLLADGTEVGTYSLTAR